MHITASVQLPPLSSGRNIQIARKQDNNTYASLQMQLIEHTLVHVKDSVQFLVTFVEHKSHENVMMMFELKSLKNLTTFMIDKNHLQVTKKHLSDIVL